MDKLKCKIYDFDIDCYETIDNAVEDIIDNKLNDANIAVAINPEKILSSRESKETYEALDIANIRYLDGIGTVKVAEYKLNKKLNRIPGCELWESLMKKAGEIEIPVYILGSEDSVLQETVSKLRDDFKVLIVGSHDGFFKDEENIINEIIDLNPKILTVALGSPRQEIFMKKCKDRGLKCFMMGVGGTYNVFTGRVKRAPKVWCNIGCEWLYRLLSEPTRIKRQVRLIKFIYLALFKRI